MLRVQSYFPSEITIDGEQVKIRIARFTPEQSVEFNAQFLMLGAPDVVAETPAARVHAAAEAERAAKAFIVQAMTEYVTVEPGQIYLDDGTESITKGADVARLYGARTQVLSEFVAKIFMENTLSVEQKRILRESPKVQPIQEAALDAALAPMIAAVGIDGAPLNPALELVVR